MYTCILLGNYLSHGGIMKVLFIGGTGTISTAISKRILELGWDLYLFNRGNRNSVIQTQGKSGTLVEITGDIREESVQAIRDKILAFGERFDVVADFIAYTEDHVAKDYAIFEGICRQFMFISSASAYQKPLSSYVITESTPLANPHWEYSRNKIACEDFLMAQYRSNGFPITIIRPSHTYDERNVPLGVHGKGSWQVLKRMIEGKPVIIHGDGTSLWTMTHNSDFARAFTGLMGNIHAIGEAVHITSDESLSWNQIYQTIADTLNVPLRAVHVSSDFLAKCGSAWGYSGGLLGDKAHSVVFDNTKLKRLVPGFNAVVRFDQGVRESIAHVLGNQALQKEDLEFDVWCDRVIAAQEKAAGEVIG